MSDWRDLFCGRTAELEHLRDVYAAVKAGDGPRMVVVLGARGMGKTRLVREFYGLLTRTHDPDGYWPDASLFQGRNLLVGPDVERDPAVRDHFASFTLGTRRMPFLWWGIRLGDPDDRNSAPADLATHRRFLTLHLAPLRQARRLDDNREALSEVGRDAAQSGIMKMMEAIPVVGPALGMLVEGATYGRRVAKLSAERRAIQEQQRSERITGLARSGAEDLIGATLTELDELFSTTSGQMAGVPLVLFLDDAQFARPGADEGVLQLVGDIWSRAVAGGWPLLLIASHWEREWRHATSTEAERDFAGTFRPMLEAIPGWRPLVLQREPELEGLVRTGLPGLPRGDSDLILERADGNPQLLIEIIDRIRRSPAWRSPEGPLSKSGRHHLSTARFELHELIRQRMESDDTPEVVRRAVAVSAVQGVEFSCALAEAAALLLEAGSVRPGLEAAEVQHGYVSGVNRGVAGFLQRAYRDAALALVDGQFGSPEEVGDALARAADRLLDDPPAWDTLESAEQATVLALRASLGEHADERDIRLRAARAMVLSARRAVTAPPEERDLARAAFWGCRFSEGLADGRWEWRDFAADDLSLLHEVVHYWNGGGVALTLGRALVDRCRADLPAEPSTGEAVEFVTALWKLAEGFELEGRFDDAQQANQEAMAVGRSLHERDPSMQSGTLLGGSLEREANRIRIEDREEEERLLRDWVDLTGEIVAAHPHDAVSGANRVLALLALADNLERDGISEEAVTLLLDAHAFQVEVVARDSTTENLRRLAAVVLGLAEAALRRGLVEEAAERFEQVITALQELFAIEPRQEHRIALGAVLIRVADVAWDRGDEEASRRRTMEARELLEAVSPPPDLMHAWRQIELYRTRGRREAILGAETLLERMREVARAKGEVSSPPVRLQRDAVGQLRDLVAAARRTLTDDPLLCWGYAELVGMLAALLELDAAPDAKQAVDAAPGEVTQLLADAFEAMRNRGAMEAAANCYQGALLSLEVIANAARDRGYVAECIRTNQTALRWCLEYVRVIGGEEAIGDLMYWVIWSGHEVLALGGRIEPEIVRACGRVALADPLDDEGPGSALYRSAALSVLATLGADIPAGERTAMLRGAVASFEAHPSAIATIAGYEAEVECGTLVEDREVRCRTLDEFAAEAFEEFDDEAREQSLEWRFLQRVRRRWGCPDGAS